MLCTGIAFCNDDIFKGDGFYLKQCVLFKFIKTGTAMKNI